MIKFGKLATIEIALWDFLMLTEWAFFSDCVIKTISDFPLLWLHNVCTCQEHARVHTYVVGSEKIRLMAHNFIFQ